MNILKKILNKETFLYLIFGILTTIVNIVSFFLFNKLFNYKLSNIIAFILAIVFAYITNKKYVFESKKEEKSSDKEFENELDVYGILNHEPRKHVDKEEEKDLDKEYEDFKKTLDEVEFENDFDKSFIEMLIGEFGSNGINESDLENAKRVFNESRENLEKGKEKEEVEKVEKTERGIW